MKFGADWVSLVHKHELPDNVKREIRAAGRDGKKSVKVKIGKRELNFTLRRDKARGQVIFQEASGYPVGRLETR